MTGIATEAFIDGADLPDAGALQRDPSLGGSGRALVDALLAHDADVVDSLLAHDSALVRATFAGQSLTEIAIATGDMTIIETVLARGAALDGTGDGGPLILALQSSAPDIAWLLLDRGAAVAPKGAPLEPVRTAIALGSSGGVRMLLDRGLDPDLTGALARRPLHVALDMEQFTIAELLIDRGADPYAIDAAGANLATAATTPMVTTSVVEAGAQARLRERLAALRWPEPHPAPPALVAMAATGNWPPDWR